jgi:hypothetical protein
MLRRFAIKRGSRLDQKLLELIQEYGISICGSKSATTSSWRFIDAESNYLYFCTPVHK